MECVAYIISIKSIDNATYYLNQAIQQEKHTNGVSVNGF